MHSVTLADVTVSQADVTVSHRMSYEEALHLPIPEAREFLGYRHTENVDRVKAGLIFAEELE